jgi:hypothetical protein
VAAVAAGEHSSSMVKIPRRDVQERYRAINMPYSQGDSYSAPGRAKVALGKSIAQAGQGIGSAIGSIGGELQGQADAASNFDAQMAMLQWTNDVSRESLARYQDYVNSGGTGQGWAAETASWYEGKGASLLESVPESHRQKASLHIERMRGNVVEGAMKQEFERTSATRYDTVQRSLMAEFEKVDQAFPEVRAGEREVKSPEAARTKLMESSAIAYQVIEAYPGPPNVKDQLRKQVGEQMAKTLSEMNISLTEKEQIARELMKLQPQGEIPGPTSTVNGQMREFVPGTYPGGVDGRRPFKDGLPDPRGQGRPMFPNVSTQPIGNTTNFLQSRLVNPSRVSDVQGLKPQFQSRLAAFIDAAQRAGHDIKILSGHRSNERQARLWSAAVKRYGSEAAARRWVAPPGGSSHNTGLAVDLSYGDRGPGLGGKKTAAVDWAHKNARAFGLHFRLGHEDWHIEPVEVTRGGNYASRIAAQFATGGGSFRGQMPLVGPSSVGGSGGNLTAVLTSGPSKRESYGWTRTNPTWSKLNPFQRAAAMALMEADGMRIDDARNVLNAIINRAAKGGENLGSHVSGKIYQPTSEAAQERRLGRILSSPQYRELVSYAQARAEGRVQDTVGGATHFLAHPEVMIAYQRKNPDKYHDWGPFPNSKGKPGINWTGYDPKTKKYANQTVSDRSHAFLAPEGLYQGSGGAPAPQGSQGGPPTPYRADVMMPLGGPGTGRQSSGGRDFGYRSANWVLDSQEFGELYADWMNPDDAARRRLPKGGAPRRSNTIPSSSGSGPSQADASPSVPSKTTEMDRAKAALAELADDDTLADLPEDKRDAVMAMLPSDGAEDSGVDVGKTKVGDIRHLFEDITKGKVNTEPKADGKTNQGLASATTMALDVVKVSPNEQAEKAFSREQLSQLHAAGIDTQGRTVREVAADASRRIREIPKHVVHAQGQPANNEGQPANNEGQPANNEGQPAPSNGISAVGDSSYGHFGDKWQSIYPALVRKEYERANDMVKSIEGVVSKNYQPNEEEIARARRVVEGLGQFGVDLAARLDATTREFEERQKLRGTNPALVVDTARRLEQEANARGGVTSKQAEYLEMMRDIASATEAGINKSILGYAQDANLIPRLEPLTDPSSVTIDQISDRIYIAKAMAQQLGKGDDWAAFSEDEKQIFSDILERGGDETLGLVSMLYKAAKEDTPHLMKEFSKSAKVGATLGYMVTAGVAQPTLNDVADGLKLVKVEGFKSRVPKGVDLRSHFLAVTGNAFTKSPETQTAMMETARVLYEQRAQRMGLGHTDADFDAELYEKGVREVAGMNTGRGENGKDDTYGGVHHQQYGGWFGSSKTFGVSVPHNIKTSEFPELIQSIRMTDLLYATRAQPGFPAVDPLGDGPIEDMSSGSTSDGTSQWMNRPAHETLSDAVKGVIESVPSGSTSDALDSVIQSIFPEMSIKSIVRDALRNRGITEKDLSGMGDGGASQEKIAPASALFARGGRPLGIEALHNARLVTIEPGKYHLATKDPLSDDEGYILDRNGNNYVLDLTSDGIGPILRYRSELYGLDAFRPDDHLSQ